MRAFRCRCGRAESTREPHVSCMARPGCATLKATAPGGRAFASRHNTERTMTLWLKLAGIALSAALSLGLAGPAAAQKKVLKVSAIYTVPVEQQWVSRLHKALK